MKSPYFLSFFLICQVIALSSIFFGQGIPTNMQNTQRPAFVTEKIPVLNSSIENSFDQLKNTIWVALDLKNNRELYVFFQQDKYGNSTTLRGETMKYPARFYPMKYIQAGNLPNSGIFVVASQEKLLYYTFYFLNPYYLIISGGYNSIDPVLALEMEEYLADGYTMQLVF